jgi:hypothetical protein
MSTDSTSPLSSPNELKKTRTGRFITVGLVATIAVIIVIIIASGALSLSAVNDSNSIEGNNPDYLPTPYTVNVISGSIAVNANSYNCVSFSVPKGALNPVLQGNFTSSGDSQNNNVIVTVMSQTDFVNWQNGRQSSTYYNKDLFPMATGNINITLPSGTYYIVFGSATWMQAKTVSAQIDLTYSK